MNVMVETERLGLLQESLSGATRTAAMKLSDLARVVVGTTMPPNGGDVPE